MQKPVLLYLIFFISAVVTNAQKLNTDSLKKLSASPIDSVRARAQLYLCRELQSSDNSKAYEYGKSALAYYRKSKFNSEKATLYKLLGNIYYDFTSFDTAKIYYDSSLVIATMAKDSVLMSGLITNIGNVYGVKGDYQKCIEYFLSSLKIDEAIKNEKGMAKTLGNIGELHALMGNIDQSLQYHKQAIELFRKVKDETGISRSHNNIGLVLTLQKKYAAAEVELKTSLEIARRIKSTQDIANALGNLTNLFTNKKEYSKALEYAQEDFELCRSNGNVYAQTLSSNMIAFLYSKMGNFEKVHEYTTLSQQLASEIDSKYLISDLYKTLGYSAAEENDFRTAFEYMKKLNAFNDSLLNENNNKQIAEMAAKYETEKKENSIRLLNIKNELQQTDLKKERYFKFLVGGIAVFIGIVALILYRNIRQKKRANLLLTQLNSEVVTQRDEMKNQKEIIEEKQKEILDSIYYARRIQRALITSEKYIKRKLDELKTKKTDV